MAILSCTCCTLMAWSQGELRWLETDADLGTFKEEDGKQSCTMRMVNVGDSALVITRVQSSCGCTAATYTTTPVLPGDTAYVTLTYNPYNRPGQFEKDAFVYSTGTPRRSRLTIRGKVIATEVTVDQRYPVRVGNLRLEVENVPLGELMRGTTRNAYINAYNAGRDTLLVSTSARLPHVALDAAPDTIPPGEAGAIVVHYDTRQAPLWGLNVDTMLVSSEPLHNSPTALAGVARIYVMAQVLEDMSRLSPDEREKAPQLYLDTDKLVWDNMPADSVTTRTLSLANRGKSTLIVRRLWCPHPAVSFYNVPDTIKKGKQATVTVAVDPSRLDDALLNTTLTVITNDPDQPRAKIRIAGMVKN